MRAAFVVIANHLETDASVVTRATALVPSWAAQSSFGGIVALARTAGRSPELLKAMRYDRALAYQETGQSRKAEADFERLLAVGPDSRDLKTRLAQSAPPASDT